MKLHKNREKMGNGNKDKEKLIINKPDINFTESSDWIGYCG